MHDPQGAEEAFLLILRKMEKAQIFSCKREKILI